MDIRPEIVDELLASSGDPAELFGADGLLAALTARLVERVTEAELDHHLRAEAMAGRKNTRNGRTKRRLLSARGPLDVSMPRDRAATFEPQLAPKYLRRLPDFDEKVLLLYSRGLSTRDIQGHLKELYQTEVSAELISDVTDALVPLFQAWQARPLAPCYVMVFLDALFVKVRVDGRVQTRALVTALGVTLDGLKDVLGLWSLEAESASAYVGVFTDLQARGVGDIVVVATDGLTGAEEAVAAVFPQADHQRCLVHQMRSSLALVTHTDRKAVATSLKAVYNAATESEAELRLAEAEAEWGARYGAVFASWRRHWPSLVTFLRYPVALRRALYTTNAVEAVHRSFRRALKHRGPLPNEMAALKLCYAMAMRLSQTWTRALNHWPLVVNQLVIAQPGRFEPFLTRTQDS
jgi:putative transposase